MTPDVISPDPANGWIRHRRVTVEIFRDYCLAMGEKYPDDQAAWDQVLEQVTTCDPQTPVEILIGPEGEIVAEVTPELLQ